MFLFFACACVPAIGLNSNLDSHAILSFSFLLDA